MNNKYPVINKNFQLHLTANDCTLFYVIKDNNESHAKLGLKEYNQWKIDRLVAKYLLLCNGKNTHDEISKSLRVPFKIVADKALEYLMKETDVISLIDSQSDMENELFITGSFESYNPLHISVEITDYCNFRCKHCYVSASPDKLSSRSYEDLISLFDTLYEKGVKVIELTGGECTTHPKFREILKYASEKFNLVAVMSNGYILGNDEDLARYVSSFTNVAVQISIDGLKDYHDEFRCKDGAFENAVKAIKNLKKYGSIVRVASTVTFDNIEDVEPLVNLCKELDVDSFATSTVSSFGRGSCYSCSKLDNKLNAMLIERLYKFKDDKLFDANKLTIEAVKENRDINCGAGWRTFALNGATGNVRICLFLGDEGVIGNIDTDSYEDIFNKNKLDKFRYAPAPNLLLDTCVDCEYKQRCNGCIAKALEVYKNYNRDCKWVKKYKIEI